MILQSARDLPKKFKRWYSNAVNSETYIGPADEVRVPQEDTSYEPNLVSSLTEHGYGHYLILDLDVEHYYIESSTNGHGHLVFGHRSFDALEIQDIYEVLSRHGVIEGGYAHMFEERGAAFIRLNKDKFPPSGEDFFMVPPDQC